jgi:hypothetical protein
MAAAAGRAAKVSFLASKLMRASEKIHDFDDEWRRITALARAGLVSMVGATSSLVDG